MKPQLWVTDIWEESDRPLLPEHTFTPSRNQTIDSLDNLCWERKKKIGLMVIPRVSKFLVTGPSLSISESRENLFSGLQMLHTLLAGICSSTSSHFVKLAGTWSSTSPHFVEPTGTWNSTSPHFVKLAGTWSSASPHLVKLAGTWSSISPHSLLVPGSSSLQSPSMISLFVGLKCPTPLGVHSHKVMSRRFLQQSHWSLKAPISQVSWGANYAVLAAYRYGSRGEQKLHQSVVAHKIFTY